MHPRIRRFLSDRHGRVVVAQWPNLPLMAWVAFALASRVSTARWAAYFDFLSGAALVTWAYLEIRYGDSPFRRVLGGVVLAALLVARALAPAGTV